MLTLEQWKDRATEVAPGLYVGEVATRAVPWLGDYGIRRVVSLLSREEAARWDTEMPVALGVEHAKHFCGEHTPIAPDRMATLVESIGQGSPGTLLHCISGVNRSQAVAVCWMVAGGMDLGEAHRRFADTRGAMIRKVYDARALLSPAMLSSIQEFVASRIPSGDPALGWVPIRLPEDLPPLGTPQSQTLAFKQQAAASAAPPDPGEMIVDPATYYDAAYWGARKPYRVRHADGRIEVKHYQGPALWWDGFGPIAEAICETLRVPKDADWLDIGCGGGCFVGFLRQRGVAAEGVDISEHAIHGARESERPYLRRGDTIASPPERPYSFVSALDLVEHIYDSDQPALWCAFWRAVRPGGVLVLNVATAHRPNEEFVHARGQPVPIEREWQAVSGHVCVRHATHWYSGAQALGWQIDRAAMEAFERWRLSTPGYRDLDAWGAQNYMVLRRPGEDGAQPVPVLTPPRALDEKTR